MAAQIATSFSGRKGDLLPPCCSSYSNKEAQKQRLIKMNNQTSLRPSKSAIRARIARGMSPEKAKSTPILLQRILTVEKVLEVEAHGLSLSKSAYLLRVTPSSLGQFVKRHRIAWRGKKRWQGGVNPFSNHQIILASGIPESTIYARMKRKGMTIDEAINLGVAK